MLELHAPAGGAPGLNGKTYRGGEFLPFYIPRAMMPQIDQADLPDFLSFAEEEGVSVLRGFIPPAHVRPHQRVQKALVSEMPPEALRKPILVSSEEYVLDGHHRLAAAQRLGQPLIPAITLGLLFEDALKLMFRFPRTYSYGDGAFHPLSS